MKTAKLYRLIEAELEHRARPLHTRELLERIDAPPAYVIDALHGLHRAGYLQLTLGSGWRLAAKMIEGAA